MKGLCAAALLLGVVMFVSCGRPEIEVVQGNYRYRQGQYAEATIHYLRALEHGRYPGFLFYNLGNVYYSLGETEPALDTLVRASVAEEDHELLFRSNFNLGNIYYELGEYEKAVNHYIQALKADAGEIDAKINLELALKKADSSSGERDVQERAEISRPPQNELRESHQRILGLIERKENENWRMRREQTAEERELDW